ncbi:MAG: undecaprenyl-phosphate galactose phosphotransferase WbaP [Bdellovibrio sp.]
MPSRLQKLLILSSDLLAQVVAYALGSWALAIYGQYSSFEALEVWWVTTGSMHTLVQALFASLVLIRFYMKGLHSKRLPFWDELRQILLTVIYLAALNGIVVLIAKWPFSRVLWLTSWSLCLLLIPWFRSLTRRLLVRLGLWARPTVIIGAGDTAWSTMTALKSEPGLGFEVLKFLVLENSIDAGLKSSGYKIEQVQKEELVSSLLKLKDENPNLQVIIALEQSDSQSASMLLERLSLFFNDVYLVPSLVGLPLFGMDAQHFFSHEVLLLRSKNNLGFRPQYVMKRTFDLVAAGLGLIAISPLLLWIALSIRKSGRGILFRQPRVGHKGQTFYCFKFRTMVPDAEKVLNDLLERDPVAKKEWLEKTKITNDPRVTPIGHFLRKTSLDELPQLINVLTGDMSLVGPRPILLHEVEKYGPRLSFYKNVKPGITGLWQVSGRSDTEYSNRVHLDTWYVKNWSLWYDIAILFKTVRVVFKREGAY